MHETDSGCALRTTQNITTPWPISHCCFTAVMFTRQVHCVKRPPGWCCKCNTSSRPCHPWTRIFWFKDEPETQSTLKCTDVFWSNDFSWKLCRLLVLELYYFNASTWASSHLDSYLVILFSFFFYIHHLVVSYIGVHLGCEATWTHFRRQQLLETMCMLIIFSVSFRPLSSTESLRQLSQQLNGLLSEVPHLPAHFLSLSRPPWRAFFLWQCWHELCSMLLHICKSSHAQIYIFQLKASCGKLQ